MDGCIEYGLTLSVDNVGEFVLDFDEEAKLILSEKAGNVADAMMNAFKPLTLRNSGCSFEVNITANKAARAKLPERWGHDRINTVRFSPGGFIEGPQWQKDYWQFLETRTMKMGPAAPI